MRMNLASQKTPLVLMGVTSLVSARTLFVLLNDPEGPNLLVVVGTATIVYLLSLAGYALLPVVRRRTKLLLAILLPVLTAAVLAGGVHALSTHIYTEKQADVAASHLDAEYVIEGQRVKLEDGIAATEVAPGSPSAVVTRYFGNELVTDLDGDGDEDIAFVLTQTMGGSGTFYYAVAALATASGYVGSDGYLLGDRIAPQTTEVSRNPRHQHVVVFNYADRAPGQEFSVQPSIGKSAYLKIDPAYRQWGIVEPDFEGESN